MESSLNLSSFHLNLSLDFVGYNHIRHSGLSMTNSTMDYSLDNRSSSYYWNYWPDCWWPESCLADCLGCYCSNFLGRLWRRLGCCLNCCSGCRSGSRSKWESSNRNCRSSWPSWRWDCCLNCFHCCCWSYCLYCLYCWTHSICLLSGW